MHSERTWAELTGLIYEAAGDTAQWIPFLERLRTILNTPWCFFYVHDLTSHVPEVHAEIGVDPAFRHSYVEHYAARNPTLTHAPHKLVPGRVCRTSDLCPEPVFLRTEFHNDWALPQRIGQGVATIVTRSAEQVGLFGVLRPFGAPALDDVDLALLQSLAPHLERAVQLHTRLRELETLQRASADALDHWQTGVVLIDRNGRILQTNHAADAALARRDGLTREGNMLAAQVPSERTALRQSIQQAVNVKSNAAATSAGTTVRISRAINRPLTVHVSAAARRASLAADARVAALVFIADPDARAATSSDLLRQVYRLTKAEISVTTLLLQGVPSAEICERLKITTNTLKTHNRNIFSKTGTRRQAELVSLLLSMGLFTK